MASEVARIVLGSTAAICTTSAFVPQILKIRRGGGRDVSYGMLLLFLVGTVLWLAYGIAIWAGAVIAANGTTTCLIVICIFLKWKCERAGSRHEVATLTDRQPRDRQSKAAAAVPFD